MNEQHSIRLTILEKALAYAKEGDFLAAAGTLSTSPLPTDRDKSNEFSDLGRSTQGNLASNAAQAMISALTADVLQEKISPTILPAPSPEIEEALDRVDAFHSAIGTGDWQAAERLLEQDKSIIESRAFSCDGEDTWLTFWSARCNAPVVEFLLRHGANPNERDKQEVTPLHHAAFSGGLDVINLLLRYGADPSLLYGDVFTSEGRGISPATAARNRGHTQAQAILSEAKEKRETQKREEEAKRHLAEENQRKRLAEREAERARRLAEETAKVKREEERRSAIRASRRTDGKCEMCGEPIVMLLQCFGVRRHRRCKEYRD